MRELEPAFLLHRRPYREQDLLVDLFMPSQGRLRAVARRARSKRSPHKALLQPFVPLQVSLFGRSDLKTLGTIESDSLPLELPGERLFAGIYLNELLMRLCPLHESQPALFVLYHQALNELAGEQAMEAILRRFELGMLDALGYGIDLLSCAEGQSLQGQLFYRWVPELGLEVTSGERPGVMSGHHLLALAEGKLEQPEVLKTARVLLRQALTPLLGDRPLASRELLMQKRRVRSE